MMEESSWLGEVQEGCWQAGCGGEDKTTPMGEDQAMLGGGGTREVRIQLDTEDRQEVEAGWSDGHGCHECPTHHSLQIQEQRAGRGYIQIKQHSLHNDQR